MNVQKFSLAIQDKADGTPPLKRFRNADGLRLIAFAIAPGFLLIRNLKTDIWPRLLQANKCRKNTILIREESVHIAGVNLLDKWLPEIMAGFGFGYGEFFGMIVHRVEWRMRYSFLKYILYATAKVVKRKARWQNLSGKVVS